jgi:predicted Zn-dependent protease
VVPKQQVPQFTQNKSQANQILQTLLAQNQLPLQTVSQVTIVHDSALNASTNGQDILITDTLWNAIPNADERAFVIGHELSHIVLRHIQQTQLRRIGLSYVDRYLATRFFKPGTLWNTAENVGLSLIDKRFSRNVEYQADDLGIQLMKKAGYKPEAAISVFKVLQQQSGGRIPEFLQDHPLSQSRIQALVKKYQLSE